MQGQDARAFGALTRGRVQLFVTADELRATRVPTIGIAGTADAALAEVKATAALVSDMQVVEIDGAHHMDTIVRPEFLRTVREFLAAHRLRSP